MIDRFTWIREIRFLWILLLLASTEMSAIGQTSHIVDVTNNVYTPKEITINPGDTIIWTNSEGRHNVNGMKSVFPSNPESFGNSVGSGWEFSHVFTLPGVYDYQCDPHIQFGMFGKVIVSGPTTVENAAKADESGSALNVYPNPASDRLHINSENSIESITIINMVGAYVRNYGNLQNNKQVISLAGIDAGIHFLEVQYNDGQKHVRKFVKR